MTTRATSKLKKERGKIGPMEKLVVGSGYGKGATSDNEEKEGTMARIETVREVEKAMKKTLRKYMEDLDGWRRERRNKNMERENEGKDEKKREGKTWLGRTDDERKEKMGSRKGNVEG